MNLSTSDIATSRFDALGTEIVVSVTDFTYLGMVLQHTHTCIDDIDHTFSRFRADSELERLHRRGPGLHPASPLFIELLSLALRASHSTDGVFDPTIRGALEAAGYDRSIELIESSGPGSDQDAVAAGRWTEIEVDARRGTVLIPEGVRLDFGGIGKGFAVDYTMRGLPPVDCGVLISAGGDLAVAGPPPDGGWICDIGSTRDVEPEETVLLRRGAMATSGLGRRQWLRDGQRLHHLIDPLSGKPSDSHWSLVTIIAGTCVAADVATKSAFLKRAVGPQWIESLGMAGRFRALDGTITYTDHWPINTKES